MRNLLGTVTLALVMPLALAAPTAAGQPAGVSKGSTSGPALDLSWQQTVVDDTQSFRGLDAVNRRVAWIAGEDAVPGVDAPGTVRRTTDGGATWQDVSPPTDDALLFRDIEAQNAETASVLAIGPGEASRIYRTTDGGETWSETFRNTEPTAFYNCLDFYPGGKRGLAVSDPVDGKFRLIRTDDGGRSWRVLPDAGMPDSTGEYNFSASGDCLVITGKDAYFGSGGTAARVFHSDDRGLTWDVTDSTIPAGAAAGVFGLAFRNPQQGIAVGGDFAAPEDGADASAYTRHGRTWTNGGDLPELGEDAAWLSGSRRLVITVGESGDVGGSSLSHDGGRTWTSFSDLGFHAVDCTRDKSCWAAGGGGRVALLERWRRLGTVWAGGGADSTADAVRPGRQR